MFVTVVLVLGAIVALPDPVAAQDDSALKGRVCANDSFEAYEDQPDAAGDDPDMMMPAYGRCYGNGLPGASIELVPMTALGDLEPQRHEATSNDRGDYVIDGLADGDYTFTVSRAGFEDATGELSVEGNDERSFSLFGEAITVAGSVLGPAGGGIADAEIQFWGHEHASASTDDAGRFAASLTAGWYSIETRAPGFYQHHDYLLLDGQEGLEIDLERLPPQTATVSGRVLDQDGSPVEDARVIVNQWQHCCYHYAYAEDEDAPEPAGASGGSRGGDMATDAMIAPYPGGGQNWTFTDANGRYTINVYEGWVDLRVEKEGYLGQNTGLEARDGGSHTQDLEAEKLPEKTARITGRIVDQDGDPVPFVSLSIESPKWGIHECSNDWEGCRIDIGRDGRFDVSVTPGYSILRVYHEHWRTCTETQHSGGGFTRDCGPEYYSWVLSTDLAADGTTPLVIELRERPGPDAVVSGYVVDAETNQALAGVQVSFSNQDGRGYGWATTDEDGSYRLRMHSGFHSVSVWADGYFHYEGQLDIAADRETSFDILMHEGEPRYGGCCYGYGYDDHEVAYASGEAAMDGGADSDDMAGGNTGGASAPTLAGGDSADAAREGGSDAAFEDLGGGLGPYDPARRTGANGGTSSIDDGEDSPGLGLVVLLAGLGAAAVALRRRS